MARARGGVLWSHKRATKFALSWIAWAGWPVCDTCHCGVCNRGTFAQTLLAYGVYLGHSGVRADRHVRLSRWHHHAEHVHGDCSMLGHRGCRDEERRKRRDVVSSELIRQGGIAQCQWVLGKVPRGIAHRLEDGWARAVWWNTRPKAPRVFFFETVRSDER